MITPPLPIAYISLAMLLALIGCNSESSTPKTNSTAPNTLQDVDSGGNQVITDFVGRDVTLTTLRALHIVRDYEAWLKDPQAAPQSSDSEACIKGGNKQLQVTNENNEFGTAGDRVSIVYDQCTEPTPAGDQTYSGDFGITFENDNATTVSISSLRIKGPGTNEILIQGLAAITTQTESNTGTTLDLTADFPELNITDVSIRTPLALLGDNISCPSDGELLIVASDGAQSRVSDFSGENMLVTISGGNPYTLACSEINPPSIEPPVTP